MDMKIYVHVNICVFLRLRRVIPSVFSFFFFFFFARTRDIKRANGKYSNGNKNVILIYISF